jgi:hypothetical protein
MWTRMRPRLAVLAVLVAASISVRPGVAHEGECPAGADGLKCEAKDTRKHACECDGRKVKGCRKATAGGWLRIRGTIQKLLKAQRKPDQAKIQSNLAKIDQNLEKVKKKVDKLIDRNDSTDDCKKAAAELLDKFGVRVDETFDSGSATTTTTLPGGGSLQGTGSISLFDPTEIIYDVSFSQQVEVFGVYVPGRSIIASLPNGVASCTTQTWTTEGDAMTADNYHECTGTLGRGVHATGNLRLSPAPVSGMPIFLYGFQTGVRYGPFSLGSSF